MFFSYFVTNKLLKEFRLLNYFEMVESSYNLYIKFHKSLTKAFSKMEGKKAQHDGKSLKSL